MGFREFFSPPPLDFLFFISEVGPEVGVEEDLEAFADEGGGSGFREAAVVGFELTNPLVLNAYAPVDVFEINVTRVDVLEHGDEVFLADTFISFEPKGDGACEEPGKKLFGGRAFVSESIGEIIEGR